MNKSNTVMYDKAVRSRVALLKNTISGKVITNITPSSLKDVISINRDTNSYSRYAFEVVDKKRKTIQNILSEYIVPLTEPRYIQRIEFTKAQCNMIQYNINALAYVVYGDVNMAWTILYLNDSIEHSGDLSSEFLKSHGLYVFNNDGINMLKELLLYKNINETNEGLGDFESLLVPDF